MAPKLPPSSRSRPAAPPKPTQGAAPRKRRKQPAAPAEPHALGPESSSESYVDRAPDADTIAAFAARRAQQAPAPPRPEDVVHEGLGPAPRRRAALAAFLEDDGDANDP